MEKLISLMRRQMQEDKIFLIPLASGQHWSLLVVDKLHKSLRYYDSLCGDPDRSKIGTHEEINNMPEKCLAMAERLLGVMSSLSLVPQEMLERPPLVRVNEKCRQPWGTNLCGQFILAYMEQEAWCSQTVPCSPCLFFLCFFSFPPEGDGAHGPWACCMWMACCIGP